MGKSRKIFTTSCYVKKNTPELIKCLLSIGYRPNTLCGSLKGDIWLVGGDTIIGVKDGCILADSKAIDCGENEGLFLALAALRDDSDKHQWFTDGYRWELCQDDKADVEAWHNFYRTYPHKATTKELFEHFKQ